MTPKSYGYTGVTPRYIYYLEQDGPKFMNYLINLYPEFGLTSEDIKRGQWKEDDAGNWESAESEDDSIIGYTATLMKDNNPEGKLQSKDFQMDNLLEVRVHMKLDNTIKYFETERGNFEIANITGFSENRSRIRLETKKAYSDDDSNKPANVWLYFGPASAKFKNRGIEEYQNCDSKRFLFFIVEHYLFKGSGENLFDSSRSALLTWMQGQQAQVKEWITYPNPTYGLVDTDLADKFKVMCGLSKECPECQGWGNFTKMDCLCDCDLGKWIARHPNAGKREIQRQAQKLMKCPDCLGVSTMKLKEGRINSCETCDGTGVDWIIKGTLKNGCDKCRMFGINRCKGRDADPKGGTAWPLTADFGCPEDRRCEICTCKACDGKGSVSHDYQAPVDGATLDTAERRRIAEDNVQPSVILCAWILALTVGVAVFLLNRHAKIAKRDAMQRGQRNWECSLF